MKKLHLSCLTIFILSCINQSFDKSVEINRSSCVSEIVYFVSTALHKFDTLVDCQCWALHHDTTFFDIYKNNGFSFDNLRITRIDNHFEAKYELWNDIAGQEIIIKAKKIQVNLNKYDYKIGDTLIGTVDFVGRNYISYLDNLTIKMKIKGSFKCVLNEKKTEYIIRRKGEIPVSGH